MVGPDDVAAVSLLPVLSVARRLRVLQVPGLKGPFLQQIRAKPHSLNILGGAYGLHSLWSLPGKQKRADHHVSVCHSFENSGWLSSVMAVAGCGHRMISNVQFLFTPSCVHPLLPRILQFLPSPSFALVQHFQDLCQPVSKRRGKGGRGCATKRLHPGVGSLAEACFRATRAAGMHLV